MIKKICVFAIGLLLLGLGQHVWAVPSLFNFGINIDGTTTCSSAASCTTNSATDLSGVAGVDDTAFDYSLGIGNIIVTTSGVGAHNVDLFLDHDVDPLDFFSEFGTVIGVPVAGQSWEIDEPGFGAGRLGTGGVSYFGDIFVNFVASTYDNQMFFDAVDNQSLTPPDDVSMGLGFDFSLLAGQTAVITFGVSQSDPGGFHLQQTSSSSESIFFSGVLDIQGGSPPVPVPEPSTLGLLGAGLLGLFMRRRRVA